MTSLPYGIQALCAASPISRVPIDAYHKSRGLSSSGLKEFMRSPAHYQAYLARERKETPALRLGRLIHQITLEPGDYEFAVSPNVDRRTKEGKAKYQEFLDSCSPETNVVTQDELDILNGCHDAVRSHPTASALLRDGHAEQSIWWIDRESGVECKCRPDHLRNDGIVVDLKTTEDASPAKFQRSIVNYGYHLQAAHYLMGLEHGGLKPKAFIFVAVEKQPPFGVGVYRISYQDTSLARDRVQATLHEFQQCRVSGVWPGYSTDIVEVDLPRWEQKKLMEEAA